MNGGRATILAIAFASVGPAAPLSASQATLEWITLSVLPPGPTSILGHAPACPTKVPLAGGGVVVAAGDVTGRIDPLVVIVNSPGEAVPLPPEKFDEILVAFEHGDLACQRDPDGGFFVASSRGAMIRGGVAALSGAPV